MGVQRGGRSAAMRAACLAMLAAGCAGPAPDASPSDAGVPRLSIADDCPTTAAAVEAPAGDDTPYAWPQNPRCAAGEVSWSDAEQALMIDGPVRCTLTELAALDPQHAPRLVDGTMATWLASYGLHFRHGAVLELHGTARGGDVDELRLRSDPGPALPDFTAADPHVAAVLRADWGGLDLWSVRLTSWDTTTNAPDLEPADGRAYVTVRSVYKGGQAQESRMDIRDSELAYLGYHAPEAYGVVWRIPDDEADLMTLFDVLNVFGDIEDSRFHDNYFGAYTFGAYGMRVRRNEFDHNFVYGFDPHDDSDALIVEDNSFHDNGTHGFICSKRCDHLQVRRNVAANNAANGIMLHSQGTDWIVEGNEVSGNGGGGIVLFESSRNVVRGNRLWNNKNGILLLSGSSDNLVEGNEIRGSASYGIYAYLLDTPLEGDGHSRRNRVRGNVIAAGATNPIKLALADDNLFEGNRIADAVAGVLIENSTGNRFTSSCVAGGLALNAKGTADAPSTVIVEESSVAASLDGASTISVQDPEGALFDDPAGRATTVTPTASTLEITGPSDRGGAKIGRLPVTVRPDSGSATARIDTLSIHEVVLSITPAAAAQTFVIAISGLQPGATFEASQASSASDSRASIVTDRVDAQGVVRFETSVAEISEWRIFVKIR